MKKFLKVFLVLLLAISFTACGKSEKKNTKVKVYVFEAGGCPYCEQEISYLSSLEDLDKKFEIVREELYVDHIDWEAGKDFELGAKVSNAFMEKGFVNATYQATPFIVISDLYASAGLDTNLSEIIDKAYEEGDKDIVDCISKNETCDIREQLSDTDKKINSIKSTMTINFIIIYVLISGILVYLYLTRSKKETSIKESPKTTKKTTKKKK